jgi:hypothetical protein
MLLCSFAQADDGSSEPMLSPPLSPCEKGNAGLRERGSSFSDPKSVLDAFTQRVSTTRQRINDVAAENGGNAIDQCSVNPPLILTIS